MKYSILTFLIVLFSQTLNAQTILADTINIEITPNIQMLTAMENGFKLDSSIQIDRIYRALEKEVPGILKQADLDEVNIRIAYAQRANSSEISWTTEQKRYGLHIDSTGAATRTLLNKDTIFIGLGPLMNVSLIFEDILNRAALKSVNIDELLIKARAKLVGDINKHTAFSSSFTLQDGSELQRTGFERNNGDAIEISGSIGLGLIRHEITPRIDASVSFDFMNKRAQLHNKLKLNASFNYSFRPKLEGGISMFVNTFVGVEYAHNFSRKEESLYGIGIHYLVGQNGPIFEGETWKINFIYYNPKYRLQIQPEVYFTNDFKEAFPGMSVMFGF